MLSGNIQSLINRRGQSATLRYKSSGTYNPATGSLGSVTNKDVSIKAYFADYNLTEINNDRLQFSLTTFNYLLNESDYFQLNDN